MTRGADKSLDNALTSTLIPQLENMPLASLGACEALYNKSVVKYFKDASRSPNRQAYFVYGQYFSLYKRIVDQIHFDYPRIEHYGPSISGKINWTRTITRSPLAPPLAFSTESRKREFDTPENILLVLCAEWMHRESNRLLSIQFDEPLTEYKKELLRHIVNQTKFILQQFPIASILNSSRRYWNLSCNDHRIKTLEYETTYRLKQGLVHNANYFLLLDWIHEFRQLDMENISDSTPSRHIIEPLLNVDTIYEIWIFMEFIEFLYEKGLLIDFRFDANQYCKFEYGGNILTFWYNRQFTEADNSWIQIHTPDFTAMIGKEIIAIFDAKNYSKSSSSVPDSINKMLAYMINLDTNFGALIYPYHPKNWDDMDRSERINNTIPIVRSQNSMLNDYNINKKARDLSKLSWEQLPKEIQDKFPLHMKIFRHPRPGKAAKYHYDQTLCQIRMSPSKSEQGISMKEKSLNSIFQEIVTRLPS
jgi:hypothetical protein